MPCEECGASTRRDARVCRDCAGKEGGTAPLGIKFICVLGGIGVFLTVLLSISLLFVGGVGTLLSLFVFGLAIAMGKVLHGLWTLQKWAWGWALIVYGLGALFDLGGLLLGNDSVESLVGLVISLGVVAYIYSKHEYYLPPTSTNVSSQD